MMYYMWSQTFGLKVYSTVFFNDIPGFIWVIHQVDIFFIYYEFRDILIRKPAESSKIKKSWNSDFDFLIHTTGIESWPFCFSILCIADMSKICMKSQSQNFKTFFLFLKTPRVSKWQYRYQKWVRPFRRARPHKTCHKIF